MSSIAGNPVLQAYLVTSVVLGLNLVGLANATALTRGKAKEVINPEDKKLTEEATVVYEEGNSVTARYRRAHRNALENVPLFLVTGLAVTMTSIPFTVAAGLFGTFAFARIAHSFCYVKAIQPFRTMFFVLGLLCQLGVLGYLGYAAAV